jgi:ankyrin repeat domain-containing protein 13
LLLAGKLSHGDEDYLKCVNFLFKYGCNGKLRDGNGWSLMDEAISQQNPRLLAIAFDWLNMKKKVKIQKNKLKVFSRLEAIPDFYTEIHWECQSSWIPFLNKIAPSDTFQIWKVGSLIRLDFSLVGFKSMMNKRRRMTVLFRDGKKVNDQYSDIDQLMVNKDRQIVVNPLEDLDEEEKLAVLTDIMKADPV